ncbi:MAG: right-handed parallel beta-helix repeat-containing protein [Trueperaceae bacterium]|nr:MAG: right-handed parallel beta-helix repeat-containing protein [Trueperaceae bacterium]
MVAWWARRRRVGALGLGPLLLALLIAGASLAQPGATVTVDSAAALLQALDHGGVVTIAPGEYDLDDTLVLRGQVDLRAEEAGTVQLNLRSAPLGVSIEPGAEVRITGLRLAYDAEAPGDVLWIRDAAMTLEHVDVGFAVGGYADSAERPFGHGSGLVASGAADVRVVGGGFGRHEGFAIEVRDASTVHLDDVVVVRNVGGIHIDGEASLTMVGGELRQHVASALEVRGRASVSLEATYIEESGSLGGLDVDAVRVGGDAEAEFRRVVFAHNPRFALSLHDRASVRSYGGLFEHNGANTDEVLVSAVWVGDGAALALHGDHLRDHAGGAVDVVGAASVLLEGVTIERTGTWAHVYAVERATVRVVGGTFTANEGGLYVGDAASAELDDVVMIGDGGDGDALLADGFAVIEVRGGRIEHHGGFGLYLLGSARASVDGTTVRGNRSGLVAAEFSTLQVHGVVVLAQERSGVGFLDAATGEVSGSTFDDNGWAGVVIAGEAVAEVTDNLFEGNANRAAWFDEAASGSFGGNTVRGSSVGLEIARDASVAVGENVFEDVGEAVVRD